MDNVESMNLTPEDEVLEIFYDIVELPSIESPQEVQEVSSEDNIEPVEFIEEVVEEDRITLPVNSPTLILGEETSRFSSAEWYDIIKSMCITVAGLGGIGSYVAFLIGRMWPSQLILYDGDRVEEANMSGQLYGVRHIGRIKSSSTRDIIREFSNFYSITTLDMLNPESIINKILICGFDNMSARRMAFNKWKHNVESSSCKNEYLFIDGRLNAEEFQVFCMTGEDTYLINKYEKEWLFSDEEAEQTVCSYKQTSYCANMIGSIMVNLLVNFATNKANPLIPRELPFITRYDATTMMLKIE